MLEFMNYEKSYGRQTEILCEDESLLYILKNTIANPESVMNAALAQKINGSEECFIKG